MSVYKKLQKARVLLNASSIKKSGKNKFAGYEYFELGDFIPTVNEIFDSVGLCGVVNFGEQATLTVYDTDGDGQVTFSSPLVFAENANFAIKILQAQFGANNVIGIPTQL